MPTWLYYVIAFVIVDSFVLSFFLVRLAKRRAAELVNDPVRGDMYVMRVSERLEPQATRMSIEIDGEVRVPGADPVRVRHQGIAPVEKWPMMGDTLPVEVQRGDHTRVNVLWDEMPEPLRSWGR